MNTITTAETIEEILKTNPTIHAMIQAGPRVTIRARRAARPVLILIDAAQIVLTDSEVSWPIRKSETAKRT